MIVWSLTAIVSYADNSWSSSSLVYDKYGFQNTGPDISKLPEIKQLIYSLGLTPVSGQPDENITKVVFRFSVITTNSRINVLADTETIDIFSNNLDEVKEALGNNSEFISNLTIAETSSSWVESTLAALNSNYEQITNLIPNKYNFWDDSTGAYIEETDTYQFTYRGINDGGDDMYDGANYLNTNLTQLYDDVKESQSDDGASKAMASIPYTHTLAEDEDDDIEYDNPPMDGVVMNGDAYFGVGSFYFTNMYPGLFVLVADNINITEFSISGNTGSDGYGVNAVAVNPVGTQNWTMFFKSNHDESSDGDPTINQMILVPGSADGLSQDYDNSAAYDDHVVVGLNGRKKLIYVLVATQPAAEPIDEEEANAIAIKVLDVIFNT